MSDGESEWTSAQRQAWQYVQSAANQDINQSNALVAYRLGGGAIRTSDWADLWHLNQASFEQQDRLNQFGPNDYIPESMFTVVDKNYSNRYTMTFTGTILDEQGNVISDVKRQVSSMDRLTRAEWQAAAAETLLTDTSVYSTEVITVTDVMFFENANMMP